MGWTTPRDYVSNEVLTAAILNVDHRDNLNVLSTHAHSNAAGNGSSTLGNLVKETFTDASAPSAPGSGLTALYTVSGRPHYRAGSSGSDTTLAIIGDVHAQTHASAHQPGGADAMAVDAATSTGSLRTLGSGSTQGAPGDHTHVAVDETAATSAVSTNDSVAMAITKADNTGNITLGSSVTIATKTLSVGEASQRIWAGGYAVIEIVAAVTNTPRLELLIDGTIIATADFGSGLNTGDAVKDHSAIVFGSADEGSGSKVCLIRVKNYASGGSNDSNYDFIGGIVCGAMKAS
jgi:hypothetical protein